VICSEQKDSSGQADPLVFAELEMLILLINVISKNKGLRPKIIIMNVVFDYLCIVKKLGFVFLFLGVFALGQDHLSGFNMMSFTYKMDPKWMAYLELQTRARRDYTVIDYYETKGGIGYNLNKNNQAFVGLGRYGTYEKMKISQEEFRLWLQYTFTQRFGRLKLDHRGRQNTGFSTAKLETYRSEPIPLQAERNFTNQQTKSSGRNFLYECF
jgi:hypothetical protein